MVASNVGRYIYIDKEKLRLSFLKHALEERSYNGFKQPGQALYSRIGSCPSTSAPAVNSSRHTLSIRYSRIENKGNNALAHPLC